MSDFRKFIFALILTFSMPWLFLIVIPVIKYQAIAPQAYDKDKDGQEGYYPQVPLDIQGQGRLVYAREGCVQCHTQMIRPPQLALDGWRKGWGQDQEGRPATAVRSNTLSDYLGENFAFLGVQRNGPDLTNYGWRAPDREKIHQKLYAPRSVHSWSNMPAMRHLYDERIVQGPVSASALKLPAKFAPKNKRGYELEVVPTIEAEALVDYLLSLKKDYPIPGTGAAVAAAPAKK